MTRQPVTAHVQETLRATLAQGLEIYPAQHTLFLPFVFLQAYRGSDYVVPPGGSTQSARSLCRRGRRVGGSDQRRRDART